MLLILYGKSDIGLVRDSNQDSFYGTAISNDVILGVVCDGMGGANGGDVASKIAVETVVKKIKDEYDTNMTSSDIKDLLINTICVANNNIFDTALMNVELSGMGTTIVLTLVIKDEVHIAYMGDSRAYIVNKDGIRQVTTDHSIIQEMIQNGEITQEQAKTHPNKNIITRALGVSIDVEADYIKEPFSKDDFLLICTDGLSNYLSAETMYKEFLNNNVEVLPDVLISSAKRCGGSDNITVVVISQ